MGGGKISDVLWRRRIGGASVRTSFCFFGDQASTRKDAELKSKRSRKGVGAPRLMTQVYIHYSFLREYRFP